MEARSISYKMLLDIGNEEYMEIIWKEKEHMQVQNREGVTFLTYPALDRLNMIRHGFSTRLGGVSQGIYSSMNLSFTRGDSRDAVMENYGRMAKALGTEPENIVTSDQTHTTNVRKVTAQDAGCGITRPRPYKDVDGMITDVPGLVLATFYADCVPLYFVDPVRRVIGLSHSGWRGTVNKMGKVTAEAMTREYGSRPEDMITAIGPSICQDCYEVSEDVAEAFSKAFPGENILKKGRVSREGQKYQLDLWKSNQRVLLEAGIKKEHISLPGICTCCNPNFLFSHRASNGKRGNLGAFLQIIR